MWPASGIGRLAVISTVALLWLGVTPGFGQCDRGTLFLADGEQDDRFGECLAVIGDELYIGVPGRAGSGWQGVVMRFERSDPWQWRLRGGIRPQLPAAAVGESIAVDAQTLVLGSPVSATVHVFHRDDQSGWREAQTLEPVDADAGAKFGAAVAVEGATLLVGSPRDQSSTEGALYVFERDADDVWGLQAKFNCSIDDDGEVGSAVALEGNLAAACGDTSALILERHPDSGWGESGRLDPTSSQFSSLSVGITGESVLLGDRTRAYNVSGAGVVNLYQRPDGSSWEHTRLLRPRVDRVSEGFGASPF
ncbi:MAG: FG-GAP repeat protein, partial [Phycisphaerales bacterium JB038]